MKQSMASFPSMLVVASLMIASVVADSGTTDEQLLWTKQGGQDAEDEGLGFTAIILLAVVPLLVIGSILVVCAFRFLRPSQDEDGDNPAAGMAEIPTGGGDSSKSQAKKRRSTTTTECQSDQGTKISDESQESKASDESPV